MNAERQREGGHQAARRPRLVFPDAGTPDPDAARRASEVQMLYRTKQYEDLLRREADAWRDMLLFGGVFVGGFTPCLLAFLVMALMAGGHPVGATADRLLSALFTLSILTILISLVMTLPTLCCAIRLGKAMIERRRAATLTPPGK